MCVRVYVSVVMCTCKYVFLCLPLSVRSAPLLLPDETPGVRVRRSSRCGSQHVQENHFVEG